MTTTRTRLLGALSISTLVVALQVGLASAGDASYPDFRDVSGLKLNGSATQTGDVLRLVDTSSQTGTAFTKETIVDTRKRFSTKFTLNMASSGFNGDGMAFVIHPGRAGKQGRGGGALGYGGIESSVIVEFDVFDNGNFDINDNHIGIHTEGRFRPSLAALDPNFSMLDRKFRVWVDYTPGNTTLSVYVNRANQKPISPLIASSGVDLDAITGADRARAGFTAATGGASIVGDVLDWRFDQ
jgi:hypothetical protein